MMIGGHAFSSDGLSWSYSPSPCFGPSVEILSHNGSTTHWLARRERPHVVLDDGGRVIALSSGAQENAPVPGWAKQKGLGSDRTYTLVVPVGPNEG